MTKPGLQHSFIQQTPLSTGRIELQDLVEIHSVISAWRDERCISECWRNLASPACEEDSVVNVEPTETRPGGGQTAHSCPVWRVLSQQLSGGGGLT